METNNLQRHQTIRSLTLAHSEYSAETAIVLWEQMATQIISIVGIGGFSSLYLRSIFLAQPSFSWLSDCALSAQAEQRFTNLKKGFEAQTPEQAIAANGLLLTTFTDILAAIIGDQLTNNILHSAWGNHASFKADKEPK